MFNWINQAWFKKNVVFSTGAQLDIQQGGTKKFALGPLPLEMFRGEGADNCVL